MAWQQWKAKQNQVCIYCGAAGAELEYHHRQPSKKLFSLGAHPEHEWDSDAVQAEIAKCDLCCHDCHRRLHRAANAAYHLPDGENELTSLRTKGFKPIHIDATLTLLRDVKANPAVATRLLRRTQ